MNCKIAKLVWIGALVAMAATLITACAPGLGKELRVDSFPDRGAAVMGENLGYSPLKVRVDQFMDARQVPSIGEINGRQLGPRGDVAKSVQRALEEKLEASGVKIALFDAPLIGGDVMQWKVSVKPDFPSSHAEAVAELQLKVFNPQNQLIYRGSYSGSASTQHPLLSQEKIEETLAIAMSEALDSALADGVFLNKLSVVSTTER